MISSFEKSEKKSKAKQQFKEEKGKRNATLTRNKERRQCRIYLAGNRLEKKHTLHTSTTYSPSYIIEES